MSLVDDGWAFAQRLADQQRLTNLAYLAGFFDGEGNIVICRDKTKLGNVNYRLRISCSQVVIDPLLIFKETFGGLVYSTTKPHPKHRDIYVWQQHSVKAVTTLTQMLPYLKVKYDQAEYAIEWAKINTKFKGKKKTEIDIQFCESSKDALSKMKGFL